MTDADQVAADRLWLDPGAASAAAVEFSEKHGVSITAADALVRSGRAEDPDLAQWLNPLLAHLTVPDEMADLPKATKRIAKALADKERIVVFGDYDCDGITSAAIVFEVLTELGGDVHVCLASRFGGGYGLSDGALDDILSREPTLLITCDCGSSDHPRLARAREAGVDAIVIDHHLVPPEPLPVVAFLNPHRPECGYPYKGLASCGLALVVAAALRKDMGVKLDVRRWLDLVAVGTIADVAPLDGDNRALVRAGLNRIAKGERIGLRALARLGSSGRDLPLTAEDVAFQLAPRLNAPGRLGDPLLALQTLVEKDPPTAFSYAEQVDLVTKKRRELQRVIVDEAMREVEERGYDQDAAICIANEKWHFGVVGIVAGRLASTFGKPTIVAAIEGERARGSARGYAGFKLYDSLAGCREHLVKFGGHQAAAGLEILPENIDAFRHQWNRVCEGLAKSAPDPPARSADVRLDQRDDVMQVLADFECFEPCGEANPAPRLQVPGVEVLSAREIKGHMKIEVRLRGRRVGGFAPQLGEMVSEVVGRKCDLIARIKRDYWGGGQGPEFLVEAIRVVAP